MISSNKIIVNTIAQYVRSITNMLFSLIATRIILKVLGVEDYGIYTLIAGIVHLHKYLLNYNKKQHNLRLKNISFYPQPYLIKLSLFLGIFKSSSLAIFQLKAQVPVSGIPFSYQLLVN